MDGWMKMFAGIGFLCLRLIVMNEFAVFILLID